MPASLGLERLPFDDLAINTVVQFCEFFFNLFAQCCFAHRPWCVIL